MIQGILDKLKDLFYKNSKKFRNTETNFSKTQGFANSELENVGQKNSLNTHKVSLCLSISGSNTPGKVRALRGRQVSSKNPSSVRDQPCFWEERKGKLFSDEGVFDLPSRQINEFLYQMQTENN